MIQLTVNASRTYQVLMAPGILADAGKYIAEALGKKTQKLCIVTDDIVKELYAETLMHSLNMYGFEVSLFVFPHGEHAKSMETLANLLEFLAQHHLTRSDALVALGGGITGDLTGFAAATYLRGIEFIQIPTTLLAAVDSSVGGKTGVNLPSGKILPEHFGSRRWYSLIPIP